MEEARREHAFRLLIVHPDQQVRADLNRAISRLDFRVESAAGDVALDRILTDGQIFSIVLLGGNAGASAVEAQVLARIEQIKRYSATSQVVLVIDRTTNFESCCQAVSAGVSGFVEIADGHIDEDVLHSRLQAAQERYEQTCQHQRTLHERSIFDVTGIAGQSKAMADVLLSAKRFALVSDAPVLINGESGTGKQMVAELIHRLDPERKNKPFLTVNCAAIAGTLADSALFGHVKCAFTGATEARDGYFRAAHGGTVLLDEIGELDITLQPKLLRVLQEGMVLPVGADRETEVNVRILAATNRLLLPSVEQGKFRLDLYHRLNVLNVDIPPLRKRREDIPLLFKLFVNKYSRYYKHPIRHIDHRVYDALLAGSLKGNVRELENTVRRILAFKQSGNEICLEDLPDALVQPKRNEKEPTDQHVWNDLAQQAGHLVFSGQMTLLEVMDQCEKLILKEVIDNSSDSHANLATRLGFTRRTFYNKLKKHAL